MARETYIRRITELVASFKKKSFLWACECSCRHPFGLNSLAGLSECTEYSTHTKIKCLEVSSWLQTAMN